MSITLANTLGIQYMHVVHMILQSPSWSLFHYQIENLCNQMPFGNWMFRSFSCNQQQPFTIKAFHLIYMYEHFQYICEKKHDERWCNCFQVPRYKWFIPIFKWFIPIFKWFIPIFKSFVPRYNWFEDRYKYLYLGTKHLYLGTNHLYLGAIIWT